WEAVEIIVFATTGTVPHESKSAISGSLKVSWAVRVPKPSWVIHGHGEGLEIHPAESEKMFWFLQAKFEIRNSKSETNPNDTNPNPKTAAVSRTLTVMDIYIFDFEIVSDFVLRISGFFPTDRLKVLLRYAISPVFAGRVSVTLSF